VKFEGTGRGWTFPIDKWHKMANCCWMMMVREGALSPARQCRCGRAAFGGSVRIHPCLRSCLWPIERGRKKAPGEKQHLSLQPAAGPLNPLGPWWVPSLLCLKSNHEIRIRKEGITTFCQNFILSKNLKNVWGVY
jgi:hypothetical protein